MPTARQDRRADALVNFVVDRIEVQNYELSTRWIEAQERGKQTSAQIAEVESDYDVDVTPGQYIFQHRLYPNMYAIVRGTVLDGEVILEVADNSGWGTPADQIFLIVAERRIRRAYEARIAQMEAETLEKAA